MVTRRRRFGLVEFVKESRLTKPARGHLAKNNLPPVKFMREVPLETDGAADSDVTVKVGDRVLVEIFEGEKFVDIVGVSKGKGFQGVVKRHHFGGGPKSPWIDVSDYGIDSVVGVSFARVQGNAHVGAHGPRPGDAAQLARAGCR